MKRVKNKYKFYSGVQQITPDTPDYSKAYELQATEGAKTQGIKNAASQFSGAYAPIGQLGGMASDVIKSNNKGKGGAQLGGAVSMGASGAALGAQLGGPWGAAAGLVAGGIYGAVTGGKEYEKGKKLQEKAELDARWANAKKSFKEGTITDAQSALAKKGKYKLKSKQPRMIETEGREPIFSPKKADGTRDLLYYNPNDPTHEEGGVKAVVMPKTRYNNGTNNLMPNRPASKYSLVGNGMMAKGVQKTKVAAPQQKMSHTDSVAHQVDKILKYEQLRGGPGGAPLPQYSDPKYKQMLMDKIYPEVSKIMPNASAMEKGEAMDLVFNAGWDDKSGKITKDPRAFALQEYYRKNDPSKLDAEGKWAGRKGAPYSFDKEYANTIGKLSENERRIMMNKGRDWYYKNINNPAPGVPNSNYKDTWYGRIHNTNDFNPFNPNNPAFIPKKAVGAKQLKVNTLNNTALSSNLGGMPAVNAANKFIQPTAGIQQVARNIPEVRRKEKIRTPRSHKTANPDTNRIIDPPMLYEMKPPAPRSTFNTKNDFKNGGKYVKVYQAGAKDIDTYKHTKTFKSKPAYQTALQAHDDSLNLYGQSKYFTDVVKRSGLYNSTVEHPEVKPITRTGKGKAPSPLKAYGAPNDASEDIITVAGNNPIRKDLYSRKESQYKSFKEYEAAKASGQDHGTHEGYEINMYKHPEMALNYEPDSVKSLQGKKIKLQTSRDTIPNRAPIKPVIVPKVPDVKVPTKPIVTDTTTAATPKTPARNKFLGKEKTGFQKFTDKASNLIGRVGSSTRKSNGKAVRVFK